MNNTIKSTLFFSLAVLATLVGVPYGRPGRRFPWAA